MAKKKSSPTVPVDLERSMAFAAALYADDKKAEDIVIMDVRNLSPVTDYYVITTATSMPHLKAVRNEVRERFWLEHRRKPIASDDNMESLWLILHYGDVMVHIFHKEKRDYYALEELWGDAPRVPWEPPAPPAPPKPAPVAKKVAKKAPALKKTATVKKAAKKAVSSAKPKKGPGVNGSR